MQRANPIQTRQALEAANAYAKAGIPFVPVPVLSTKQRLETLEMATRRLEQLENESEQ
ncbi:DUF1382 family protein [Vreelandella populi]|uniref:DUF1382 family protein n=1 Tax=Vreelandella populi TaxID=2498858 RepID=UPI00163CBC74|nr:DUF1382 family protein [Halomonas populi]